MRFFKQNGVLIDILSGLLGFWQEKKAADAVEKLLAIVQIKARVLRDGAWAEAPVEEIVPGDIALLNAGNIPAMAIATDSVDRELVEKPRRWDIKFIRDFMIVFGVVSSVFYFLTFGALLFLLNADAEQFRTGWFLESVMTELLILPVIRTWRPFYQSRPSKPLWVATVIVLAVTLALPYLPLNRWLGFSPLPVSFILVFAGITGGYLIASEMTKKFFYRRAHY